MSIVEVREVSKRFGEHEVLHNVSFDLGAGEVLVLLGRSGSGKSTLLRCLNGLEAIDGGRIVVAGHAVTRDANQLRALRRDVGIVFQQYNLFPHLTVGQNIMLAPRLVNGRNREQAEAEARNVLSQVGLSDRFDAFPSRLSGGQQQRVAIARSLAMQPRLMLFDEVTSALDPELTAEVLAVMETLARQGMAMIVVTHEMGFARRVAQRVIFMHNGRIHETGRPEDCFERPATPEFESFLGAVM